MTEAEIRKRLAELAAERRMLMDMVEDRGKPFDKEKFDAELKRIVEEERGLERQLSEILNPLERGEPSEGESGSFFEVRGKETRATLSVGGEAKALAPEKFVAELVAEVEKEAPLYARVNRIPVSGAGSLGYPFEASDASDAVWTNEIPDSEISADTAWSFGKRELAPSDLTKLILVTKKLLATSALPIDSMIRGKLAAKFAAAYESGITVGTGTNQPLGVFSVKSDASGKAIGIGTDRDVTAASASAITADDLINVKMKLRPAYRRKAVWVMSTAVLTAVMKLKDSNGQYIWREGLRDGDPGTLLGLPVIESEYAPSDISTKKYVAVLGDFSKYWFAYWKGLEVEVLNEKFALKNQVGIKGYGLADGHPVQPAAFARLVMA